MVFFLCVLFLILAREREKKITKGGGGVRYTKSSKIDVGFSRKQVFKVLPQHPRKFSIIQYLYSIVLRKKVYLYSIV